MYSNSTTGAVIYIESGTNSGEAGGCPWRRRVRPEL